MAQSAINPTFAPDLVAQQTKLMRSQAMADLLRQQSMEPSEGTEIVGGWAIPKSPLAGLSKLAQALGSNYMTSKNDTEQAALSQALATRQNAAYDQLLGVGAPTAQPSAQPQVADANGQPIAPYRAGFTPPQAPTLSPQQQQAKQIKLAMMINPALGEKLAENAMTIPDSIKAMDLMGQDRGLMGQLSTTKARNDATLITSPNQVVTSPEGKMSITPDAASGMQTTVGANGQLITSPIQGSAEAAAARAGLIAQAQEQPKASFDLIDVDTPQGVLKMTRAQAAKMAGGGISPTATGLTEQSFEYNPNQAVSGSVKLSNGQTAKFDGRTAGEVVTAVQNDKTLSADDRDRLLSAVRQSVGGVQKEPVQQGIKLQSETEKERKKQLLGVQTDSLKKITATADTMRDVMPVFEQIRGLMKEGTYGNSPQDRLASIAHNYGLNNSSTATNTEALKKLGHELVLAHGSLGAGVSSSDAERYDKASGDFTNAQSNQDRIKYLDIMQQVAEQAAKTANTALQQYQQTGSLPSYNVPTSPKPAQSQTFESLPNPAQYAGKRMRAPDGTIIVSNGKSWVKGK
jgi:hypothetical protein